MVVAAETKMSRTNISCLDVCRPLRVSTNLRRFANQDLSPNADREMQQPDWAGYGNQPYDSRWNDDELGRDRSYPDNIADPGFVQSGYVVPGYPEGVVMRNKPADRPYYPYDTQFDDFEGYPQHDNTRMPGEQVPGGNIPTRAAAAGPATAVGPASPGALVSGSPQDLYAKVIKPSERDKNMIPRQPREVDTHQPYFEPRRDGNVGSDASFSLRPDGGRFDDRWRPTAAPVDAGPTQQRDLRQNRDHNYNVNKPSSTDGFSNQGSQPRVYRPGERHIDGTPMFGDPSKDATRPQVMSQNGRPSQLPVPSSMRGQYIDDLAASKTPHTQNDLMQAKALSQQRHGQPSYFQYPERDTPRQVMITFDHCVISLCLRMLLLLIIALNLSVLEYF